MDGRCPGSSGRINILEHAAHPHPRWAFVVILVVVLFLRLPFLNQAIQGDDYYYLAGAMHAQIDPLHPTHGRYVFAGEMVEMRGHPHPPLNMWVLGGLLAAFGDIREIPFHAAYALFSLLAAGAMWRLARRFSPAPLWATLLFLATPAFVINGNSLEADIPFLALWMATAACYVTAADRRSLALLLGAAALFALAALAAYQAVVLVPILALYLLLHRPRWIAGWAALASPAAVLAAWQIFEKLTGGAMPASVLSGHFESYGFQALANKLDNAVALTVHSGWLLFPLLALAAFWRVPRRARVAVIALALAAAVRLDPHPLFWLTFLCGLFVILWCLATTARGHNPDERFLAAWVAIFFAAALLLFFAGSARYLLPMAAPVALLASRNLRHRQRWLAAGCVLQFLLSISLSVMNYQHWDGYRDFVASLREEFAQRRVWVNAEWGLRYYAEAQGGLTLLANQPVQPGEAVISSEICYPMRYTTGGGELAPLASRAITSALPFRLIGIGAKAGYSTVTLGYRPFDISWNPIDRVRAAAVVKRQPELSYLPMNAPQAEFQISSGVYDLEQGQWRWIGPRARFLMKPPEQPAPLAATIYIPEQSPVRTVTLAVDGQRVAAETVDGPGSYTVRSPGPARAAGDSASVEILCDRGFSPEGDLRELSVILTAVGFEPRPQ